MAEHHRLPHPRSAGHGVVRVVLIPCEIPPVKERLVNGQDFHHREILVDDETPDRLVHPLNLLPLGSEISQKRQRHGVEGHVQLVPPLYHEIILVKADVLLDIISLHPLKEIQNPLGLSGVISPLRYPSDILVIEISAGRMDADGHVEPVVEEIHDRVKVLVYSHALNSTGFNYRTVEEKLSWEESVSFSKELLRTTLSLRKRISGDSNTLGLTFGSGNLILDAETGMGAVSSDIPSIISTLSDVKERILVDTRNFTDTILKLPDTEYGEIRIRLEKDNTVSSPIRIQNGSFTAFLAPKVLR